tara:strand:- start:134 stop:571 length:438 start_codon:yes stop_codon:yes gene_type:complete
MDYVCDYENPWIYNGHHFLGADVGNHYGFVYLITNLSNRRSYIGRKYFWTFRTPKGKKRKVRGESDWRNYYGSCDELKEDIKTLGKDLFRREILSLHLTKGKVNFAETEALFKNNVLTESMVDGTPKYYNSNIMNRYYKKDYFET